MWFRELWVEFYLFCLCTDSSFPSTIFDRTVFSPLIFSNGFILLRCYHPFKVYNSVTLVHYQSYTVVTTFLERFCYHQNKRPAH